MPHLPNRIISHRYKNLAGWLRLSAAIALPGIACAPLFAQFSGFTPNNLVVSRSVYSATASTITIGEQLPLVCGTQATCPGQAVANGSYPFVFNNDAVDGQFGITSPILLDQISTGGALINTLAIPTSGPDQIVTSFSSKSELALNLSLDGRYITFMGYVTSPNTIDASNANTPGLIDPTDAVGSAVYRGVAQVDALGNVEVTDTNAYSGDNGRGVIYTGDPNGVYFTVGNDNSGNQPTGLPLTPVLAALVNATGAQVITPGATPGTPLQAGSFNVTEEGDKADKPGKDNNFRGLTIFKNTLYVTKGSGSNGIDTVYQVGTAGTLPITGGATITILPGFPTVLAKKASINTIYPFGIWFANSTTLYVADEGDGNLSDAGISTLAGLQKWSLVNGSWTLDYVLQNGLNLGQPYGIANYPSSLNPATAGLRNITGRVNADGTATIWATTSTVSNNADQGADPNLLVSITDLLANTSPAAASGEQFTIVKAAKYGEVLRGVAFTPGSTAPPAPGNIVVTSSALVYSRATKDYTGTLTITNNSSSPISGEVVVALTGLTTGVTLNGNPPTFDGSPAVIFPAGTLNPGQSASQPISFSDPSNARIVFTPVIIPVV